MNRIVARALALMVALPAIGARAETVVVDSKEALIEAAKVAGPGTVIKIAPGNYPGGIFLSGLEGTAAMPIVIEPVDPMQPPVFLAEKGGKSAIHLSGCSYVTLRRFHVMGFPINGINVDDGGDPRHPAIGIRFEGLTISLTGPRGNHDALKLSGLTDFFVGACFFHGWGGSAIDMVGCHNGKIVGCGFAGRKGYSQANGVQMKGGSSKILVKESVFDNAGQRGINLGGSTGLPHFRPADATWEAGDIEVTQCVFTGSLAPIAWVGIDGGYVHHNLFFKPEKWVARILQENSDPRFGRCRNGRFESNLVVFDKRVQTFVNIGGNTEPKSFTFRDNAWFDVDDPKRGPAGLPGTVSGNVVGIDPIPDHDFPIFQSKDPRLEGIGPGNFGPDPKLPR